MNDRITTITKVHYDLYYLLRAMSQPIRNKWTVFVVYKSLSWRFTTLITVHQSINKQFSTLSIEQIAGLSTMVYYFGWTFLSLNITLGDTSGCYSPCNVNYHTFVTSILTRLLVVQGKVYSGVKGAYGMAWQKLSLVY